MYMGMKNGDKEISIFYTYPQVVRVAHVSAWVLQNSQPTILIRRDPLVAVLIRNNAIELLKVRLVPFFARSCGKYLPPYEP